MSPFAAEDLHLAVSRMEEACWARLRCQRIFVTGGTGFVGRWLLATLLEAQRRFDLDCDIVVLTRDPAAFARQAPHLAAGSGVRLLAGNVLDFKFPDGEFDVAIHAATDVVASSTPLQTFDTCVAGTRRVLDFSTRARVKDFLLVSSGAVYGRQPPELAGLRENYNGAPDTLSIGSAYGQGKRAAEWLTAACVAQQGTRFLTARLFAFLGPGMPLDGHFAIGNFLRDAMAKRSIVVQGDGTSVRSYLYAADMAGWMWKILFNGRSGEAYNVGGEDSVTIADLARRVTSLLESPAPVDIRGQPALSLAAERYVPDISKAREELGLDVSLSLDEGIRRTARWHRESALHR